MVLRFFNSYRRISEGVFCMNKRIQEEFEFLKGQRYLPPVSSPEAEIEDYEDFDDSNKMESLWNAGEEAYHEELMSAEDY